MSFVIEDVLVRDDPQGRRVPLILDSPHSGNVYPRDFGFVCPFRALRQAEDTHVDELIAVSARAWRHRDQRAFPAKLYRRQPGHRRHRAGTAGISLARTDPPQRKELRRHGTCPPPVPAGNADVRRPAERWRRLHGGSIATIAPTTSRSPTTFDRLYRHFGSVYHLNCHSMPTFGRDPRPAPISSWATATARPATPILPATSPGF